MVAENAFCVSWEQFLCDVRGLATRLIERGPFLGIVAITRGGLIPAAIVARELDVRVIDTISIASYDEENIQRETQVLKCLSSEIAAGEGERILVVDDLADTGATMKIVRTMLPKAHISTLYVKPIGRPVVDTYVTEVSQNTWIYFPWDLDRNAQELIAKGKDC